MNKTIISFVLIFAMLSGAALAAENYYNYARFDLYIEESYDSANHAGLMTFFDNFAERLDLLESVTGWSSEKANSKKLEIHVTASSGCYGGSFYFGGTSPYVQLRLSNPLYMAECQSAYRDGGVWKLGNPGELGDMWPYMQVALHETSHAINPSPVCYRTWLTEGWAQFNSFNLLALNGDINQETADYYINHGSSYYNWAGYTANDYKDTSPSNYPIQSSAGYDITAWMYSMMRDVHGMSLPYFFSLLDNNLETLNRAFAISGPILNNYKIDMFMIDVLGRAAGIDPIPVWRYDSSSGPGWGVRTWESLSWYADLSPVLSFSKTNPIAGETITLRANISNTGDTSLTNVKVRFYNGASLIAEQSVSVAAHSSINVVQAFSSSGGTYSISVKVDEQNLKVETNELNNNDVKSITFTSTAPIATADSDKTSGTEPLRVRFTGSAVEGSLPYVYSWDFGDGRTSSSQNPTHTYQESGEFTAVLTVTDAEGDKDTDSIVIHVADAVPVAGLQGPDKVRVNEAARFDASLSSYEYSDPIVNFEWDFSYSGGFNSELETLNTPYCDHSFTSAGTYTVAVKTTDSDGSTSIATKTITVENSASYDLEASQFSVTNVNGREVTVKFVVTNKGNTAANGISWLITPGPSEANVTSPALFDLNPGEDMWVFAKLNYTSAGNHNATLQVDYINSFAEFDETNNNQIITINLT